MISPLKDQPQNAPVSLPCHGASYLHEMSGHAVLEMQVVSELELADVVGWQDHPGYGGRPLCSGTDTLSKTQKTLISFHSTQHRET